MAIFHPHVVNGIDWIVSLPLLTQNRFTNLASPICRLIVGIRMSNDDPESFAHAKSGHLFRQTLPRPRLSRRMDWRRVSLYNTAFGWIRFFGILHRLGKSFHTPCFLRTERDAQTVLGACDCWWANRSQFTSGSTRQKKMHKYSTQRIRSLREDVKEPHKSILFPSFIIHRVTQSFSIAGGNLFWRPQLFQSLDE